MKNSILTLLILINLFSFQNVFAQLAKRGGITTEQIIHDISKLAEKNDDASKSQLLIEAKALLESKNEC